MVPGRSFPGFVTVAVEQLEELSRIPGVTGYCLITTDGHVCSPARGPLADELGARADASRRVGISSSSSTPPTAAVTQFLRPFNCLQPAISFSALGTKLLVVHQAEGSVFALGPRRRVGLGACLVPQGVVVVTFDRSLPLPAAVAAAERCAAAIRVRCAAA